MGGSRKLVNECGLERCTLQPFRMGRNPNFSFKREDRQAVFNEI
jgi:hypothetical protein